MSAESQPRGDAGETGVWHAGSVADELETLFVEATGRRSMPGEPAPSRPKALEGTVGAGRTTRPAVSALMAAGLVGLAVGVLLVPSRGGHRVPVAEPVAAIAASAAAPSIYAAPPVLSVAEPVRIDATRMPKLVKASTPRVAPSACRHARCTHAELLEADRRLRTAFSRAVDAGVPRAVLVDYRDRWASLRRDAVYRPNRVASGYGAMAGDLNRLASRRHTTRHSS